MTYRSKRQNPLEGEAMQVSSKRPVKVQNREERKQNLLSGTSVTQKRNAGSDETQCET